MVTWGTGGEVGGFIRISGGPEGVWGIGQGPPEESLRRLRRLEAQEVCGYIPERGSWRDEEVVFAELGMGIGGMGSPKVSLAGLGGL